MEGGPGSPERAWTSEPAWRASLAAAVPLAAALGALVASASADALGLRSADARFVAVTLGVALPVWLARVARPGGGRRAGWIVAALGVPWLASVLAPRSALAVSWLAGGALFLGLEALAHAGKSAWRLGSRPASRAALAGVAAGPGLYLFAAVFVVLFNTQLVMAPARLAHLSSPLDAGEEDVVLRTDDGYRLAATYTPPADERRGAAGVVLVHGVADARGRFVPWARRLSADGYHVMRLDVRGHGQSEGAVVTYGQREDADVCAAVEALRARGLARIAVVGASMGGGVVLAAAPSLRGRGVRALILLAPASRFPPLVARRVAFLGPFADLVLAGSARVARAMGQTPMTEWVPAERLPPGLPVLVLHGDADGTIPLALSEALAEARPDVELVALAGVGHDELPAASAADDATWRLRVAPFLSRHLIP